MLKNEQELNEINHELNEELKNLSLRSSDLSENATQILPRVLQSLRDQCLVERTNTTNLESFLSDPKEWTENCSVIQKPLIENVCNAVSELKGDKVELSLEKINLENFLVSIYEKINNSNTTDQSENDLNITIIKDYIESRLTEFKYVEVQFLNLSALIQERHTELVSSQSDEEITPIAQSELSVREKLSETWKIAEKASITRTQTIYETLKSSTGFVALFVVLLVLFLLNFMFSVYLYTKSKKEEAIYDVIPQNVNRRNLNGDPVYENENSNENSTFELPERQQPTYAQLEFPVRSSHDVIGDRTIYAEIRNNSNISWSFP